MLRTCWLSTTTWHVQLCTICKLLCCVAAQHLMLHASILCRAVSRTSKAPELAFSACQAHSSDIHLLVRAQQLLASVQGLLKQQHVRSKSSWTPLSELHLASKLQQQQVAINTSNWSSRCLDQHEYCACCLPQLFDPKGQSYYLALILDYRSRHRVGCTFASLRQHHDLEVDETSCTTTDV